MPQALSSFPYRMAPGWQLVTFPFDTAEAVLDVLKKEGAEVWVLDPAHDRATRAQAIRPGETVAVYAEAVIETTFVGQPTANPTPIPKAPHGWSLIDGTGSNPSSGPNTLRVVSWDPIKDRYVELPRGVRLDAQKAYWIHQPATPESHKEVYNLQAPTRLQGVFDGQAIRLQWVPSSSWEAIPEMRVGYRLYRNGEHLADTTETSFVDAAPRPGTYRYAVTGRTVTADGRAIESKASKPMTVSLDAPRRARPPGAFHEPEKVGDGGRAAALPKVRVVHTRGKIYAHLIHISTGSEGPHDVIRYQRSEKAGKAGSFTSPTALYVPDDPSWKITDIALAAQKEKLAVAWIESSNAFDESRLQILTSHDGGDTWQGRKGERPERVQAHRVRSNPNFKRGLDMAYDHLGNHHLVWGEKHKTYYLKNLRGPPSNVFDEHKRAPIDVTVDYYLEYPNPCPPGEDPDCGCTEFKREVYSLGLEKIPSHKENKALGCLDVIEEYPHLKDSLPKHPSGGHAFGPYFFRCEENYVSRPALHVDHEAITITAHQTLRFDNRPIKNPAWVRQYGPPTPERDPKALCSTATLRQKRLLGFRETWKPHRDACDPVLSHDSGWYQQLYAGQWDDKDTIKVAQRPIVPKAWSSPVRAPTTRFEVNEAMDLVDVDHVSPVRTVEVEGEIETGWRQGVWQDDSFQTWRVVEVDHFEGLDRFTPEPDGCLKTDPLSVSVSESQVYGPSHPSVVSTEGGQMFVAYEKGPSSDPGTPGMNPIHMTESSDGGQTWSEPTLVTHGYMPKLAATSRGDIALGYYAEGVEVIRRKGDGSWSAPQKLNVHAPKPIHPRALGHHADRLYGVPDLTALDQLLVASWIRKPDGQDPQEGIMLSRAAILAEHEIRRHVEITPKQAKATGGTLGFQVTVDNQFHMRAPPQPVEPKNGPLPFTLSVDAHDGPVPKTERTFSSGDLDALQGRTGEGMTLWTARHADGATALSLGLAVGGTEIHATLAGQELLANMGNNYARALQLRDTLYNPKTGGQREYQNDPNDKDSETLSLFDRVWVYTQGIALAQAARQHHHEKARDMARWLCDHATWSFDDPGDAHILGWNFSYNTHGDDWKDVRLVTGASAWAVHGLGVFLASPKAAQLEPEFHGDRNLDDYRHCYRAALLGLGRYRTDSGLMRAGMTAQELVKMEDGQTYYGVLDRLGYDEIPKTMISATNVVTEHNLDVLSVLNHALGHPQNHKLDIPFLETWRDDVRHAILTELWDESERRVITGGTFDQRGHFRPSPFSAIDNCSWLSISVDYKDLVQKERDQLADCLQYTIDHFVKPLRVPDGAHGPTYRGTHYFPREFRDPYIQLSEQEQNKQPQSYHLEATAGLVLGLWTFVDHNPGHARAEALGAVGDDLWLWMQRFVEDHGFMYSSQRIQDLSTKLESSTALIWFIDVYDYAATRGRLHQDAHIYEAQFNPVAQDMNGLTAYSVDITLTANKPVWTARLFLDGHRALGAIVESESGQEPPRFSIGSLQTKSPNSPREKLKVADQGGLHSIALHPRQAGAHELVVGGTDATPGVYRLWLVLDNQTHPGREVFVGRLHEAHETPPRFCTTVGSPPEVSLTLFPQDVQPPEWTVAKLLDQGLGAHEGNYEIQMKSSADERAPYIVTVDGHRCSPYIVFAERNGTGTVGGFELQKGQTSFIELSAIVGGESRPYTGSTLLDDLQVLTEGSDGPIVADLSPTETPGRFRVHPKKSGLHAVRLFVADETPIQGADLAIRVEAPLSVASTVSHPWVARFVLPFSSKKIRVQSTQLFAFVYLRPRGKLIIDPIGHSGVHSIYHPASSDQGEAVVYIYRGDEWLDPAFAPGFALRGSFDPQSLKWPAKDGGPHTLDDDAIAAWILREEDFRVPGAPPKARHEFQVYITSHQITVGSRVRQEPFLGALGPKTSLYVPQQGRFGEALVHVSLGEARPTDALGSTYIPRAELDAAQIGLGLKDYLLDERNLAHWVASEETFRLDTASTLAPHEFLVHITGDHISVWARLLEEPLAVLRGDRELSANNPLWTTVQDENPFWAHFQELATKFSSVSDNEEAFLHSVQTFFLSLSTLIHDATRYGIRIRPEPRQGGSRMIEFVSESGESQDPPNPQKATAPPWQSAYGPFPLYPSIHHHFGVGSTESPQLVQPFYSPWTKGGVGVGMTGGGSPPNAPSGTKANPWPPVEPDKNMVRVPPKALSVLTQTLLRHVPVTGAKPVTSVPLVMEGSAPPKLFVSRLEIPTTHEIIPKLMSYSIRVETEPNGTYIVDLPSAFGADVIHMPKDHYTKLRRGLWSPGSSTEEVMLGKTAYPLKTARGIRDAWFVRSNEHALNDVQKLGDKYTVTKLYIELSSRPLVQTVRNSFAWWLSASRLNEAMKIAPVVFDPIEQMLDIPVRVPRAPGWLPEDPVTPVEKKALALTDLPYIGAHVAKGFVPEKWIPLTHFILPAPEIRALMFEALKQKGQNTGVDIHIDGFNLVIHNLRLSSEDIASYGISDDFPDGFLKKLRGEEKLNTGGAKVLLEPIHHDMRAEKLGEKDGVFIKKYEINFSAFISDKARPDSRYPDLAARAYTHHFASFFEVQGADRVTQFVLGFSPQDRSFSHPELVIMRAGDLKTPVSKPIFRVVPTQARSGYITELAVSIDAFGAPQLRDLWTMAAIANKIKVEQVGATHHFTIEDFDVPLDLVQLFPHRKKQSPDEIIESWHGTNLTRASAVSAFEVHKLYAEDLDEVVGFHIHRFTASLNGFVESEDNFDITKIVAQLDAMGRKLPEYKPTFGYFAMDPGRPMMFLSRPGAPSLAPKTKSGQNTYALPRLDDFIVGFDEDPPIGEPFAEHPHLLVDASFQTVSNQDGMTLGVTTDDLHHHYSVLDVANEEKAKLKGQKVRRLLGGKEVTDEDHYPRTVAEVPIADLVRSAWALDQLSSAYSGIKNEIAALVRNGFDLGDPIFVYLHPSGRLFVEIESAIRLAAMNLLGETEAPVALVRQPTEPSALAAFKTPEYAPGTRFGLHPLRIDLGRLLVLRTTFRVDPKPHTQAFKNGFTAKGTELDLSKHVYDGDKSGWISTTKRMAWVIDTVSDARDTGPKEPKAKKYGPGRVYVVRPREGVDLDTAHGLNLFEHEIAVEERISGQDVLGVFTLNEDAKTGVFKINNAAEEPLSKAYALATELKDVPIRTLNLPAVPTVDVVERADQILARKAYAKPVLIVRHEDGSSVVIDGIVDTHALEYLHATPVTGAAIIDVKTLTPSQKTTLTKTYPGALAAGAHEPLGRSVHGQRVNVMSQYPTHVTEMDITLIDVQKSSPLSTPENQALSPSFDEALKTLQAEGFDLNNPIKIYDTPEGFSVWPLDAPRLLAAKALHQTTVPTRFVPRPGDWPGSNPGAFPHHIDHTLDASLGLTRTQLDHARRLANRVTLIPSRKQPEAIFVDGFQAEGTETHLMKHLWTGGQNSAYVTTLSHVYAALFGDTFYFVRPQDGIALGAIFPGLEPFNPEVLIPREVSPSDIWGVLPGGGRFIIHEHATDVLAQTYRFATEAVEVSLEDAPTTANQTRVDALIKALREGKTIVKPILQLRLKGGKLVFLEGHEAALALRTTGISSMPGLIIDFETLQTHEQDELRRAYPNVFEP